MDAQAVLSAIVPVVVVAAVCIAVAMRVASGDRRKALEVAPIAAVFIVAIAVITMMPDTTHYEDQEFEYLDCVPVSVFGSPSSVSGAGELVEIGGEGFVRMKDVGRLEVDGRLYRVLPASLDLIVTAGQSNSYYFSSPALYGSDSPATPGKAFYYGRAEPIGQSLAGIARADNIDGCGIVDMTADDGSVNIGSYYPGFAADYYEETGHRVVMVATGLGGAPIRMWREGGDADVLARTIMEGFRDLCEDPRLAVTPVATLWIQGEANYDTNLATYKQDLHTVMDNMASGYYGGFEMPRMTAFLPTVPGRTVDDMIDSAKAQVQVAEEDPYLTIASDLSYRFTAEQFRDTIHYTQAAYSMAGEAFARELAEMLELVPVDETIVIAEQIGEVSALPDTVSAYGTSGAQFELSASWAETGTSGTYAATLSGNPAGTRIAEGLSPQAVLETA